MHDIINEQPLSQYMLLHVTDKLLYVITGNIQVTKCYYQLQTNYCLLLEVTGKLIYVITGYRQVHVLSNRLQKIYSMLLQVTS